MRSAVLVALVLVGAGCEATLGLDGLTFDRDEAVPAGGATSMGGAGPTTSTGGSGGAPAGGGGAGGGSPDGALVAVPNGAGFLVDFTEVTVEAYAAFLEGAPDPMLLGATCSWNDSLQPGAWTDVGLPEPADCPSYDLSLERTLRPDDPIVCVDWCDASTYCASRGATLCGLIQGGTAGGELPIQDAGDLPLLEDEGVSAWYRACTDGGTQAYAYGNSYAEVCNDAAAQEGGVAATGSYEQCGRDGVFDLSGNAEEWTAECYQASPVATSACARRGGAYYDIDAADLSCAGYNVFERAAMSVTTSFRCCTPR